MATDLDRLSDLADAASYLANQSYRLDDHKKAADAHYTAFRAGKSSQAESRPSLCQSHLERAAKHDKIANDPESYEQKDVLACSATRDADRAGTAAAHRKAATAHDAAVEAWKKSNPEIAEPGWEVRNHEESAKRHRDVASLIDRKGGGDETPPAKIGEKAPPPATPAKNDTARPSRA